MSPAMAAAAAITGHLIDARKLGVGKEFSATSTSHIVPAISTIEASAIPVKTNLSQSADAVDDGVAMSAAAPPAATSEGPMPSFTVVKGIAAPMEQANIDTDKIIPARFLKTSALL